MAGLSDIVTITITSNSRTPTRAGFGTPLLMTYHTAWTDKIRTYTDLSGLISDGFTSHSPTYRMAQSLLSQNPRPERFKVGRLTTQPTVTYTLTMTSATQGDKVSFTVVEPLGGTEVPVTYTIGSSETTTTVATAVELLVEAVSGVNSSSSGAVITVTPATAGDLIYFHSLVNCTLIETTADAGYDDDLTALQLIDDDWYLVLLDVNSEANVDLVAAWTETRTKLFIAQTQNDVEKNGSGTLGAGLNLSAYDRTALLFAASMVEYPACAWAGVVLPQDPGSITWMFKELKTVSPSLLSSTQETNLFNYSVNTYQTIAGLDITRKGTSVSGEYMDVRHGLDWLQARLQEGVFGLLANAGKIPYTDASVDIFVNEIKRVLNQGVERNFIAAGSITASGPKVADVDSADRANRILPDLKFGATLAGAVHKVEIQGTVSV